MILIGGAVAPAADPSRLAGAINQALGISRSTSATSTLASAATTASSAQAIAANERWLLVADGRLDEVDGLATPLGLHKLPPTVADLLLAAWATWGEASVNRLYGDFAFAVYDRALDRLSLVRDATGQRPLFYKCRDGALAFASLPNGLAETFQPSRPNLRLLALYQANLLHSDRQSFFEGIHRVMPGEIVHWTNNQLQHRTYWQPSTDPEQRDIDYVEAYRSLLDKAVGCRLSDARLPVGTHLSSGYDSSAVTGTAARLIGRPDSLIAFTAAPLEGVDTQLIRHRFADESPVAMETARMHGIRHQIIRETPPLFDVVERQTALMQSPQFSPFNMVWWTEIRRRAVELGIDTILTAEIGNLSLNASGLRTLSPLIAAGQWGRWWREATLAVKRSDIRWRGVLMTSFEPWMPAAVKSAIRRLFQQIPPTQDTAFLRGHWDRQVRSEAEGNVSTGNPYRDRLNVIRLNDLGLHRKAAEAEGLSERDPMSDRRLIEFSLTLPFEQLFKDGVPRPLARRALSDRVPQSVLNLQLRGMQGADWHLRVSQQRARQILETISVSPEVDELLDLPKLAAAIDAWPTGDWNSYRVFRTYRDGVIGALAVGIFLVRFKEIGGRR